MKNKIKIAALAVAVVLSFSSCKKTYECHCDKVGGGDVHFEIKAKKSDAEAQCKAIHTSSSTQYNKCEIE